MKKYNILLTIILFILFLGIFFVSAEDPVLSDNDINNITTNNTAFKSQTSTIEPLESNSKDPDDKIGIEVYWDGLNNSDIDLGTVIADGSTYSYLNRERIYNTGKAIDLYVRASGNLTNEYGNTISIDNLKYADYGDRILNLTSFTISPYVKVINDWKSNDDTPVYVDLYLTVPPDTDPGHYSVTIYHVAIKHNELPI